MKRPNKQMLGTAFLSGRNIATVYEEAHSIILEKYDLEIGAFYTEYVTNCMRWFWDNVQVRLTDNHLMSPKQTIIDLNKAALKRIIEQIGAKNLTRCPSPQPDPVPVPLYEIRAERVGGTRASRISELPVELDIDEDSHANVVNHGSHDIPTRCSRLSEVVWDEDPVHEPKDLTRYTDVLISSRDRNSTLYPDAHGYSVDFVHENVVEINLLEIEVSVALFPITPLNNKLHFAEDDDPMHSVVVEPGEWSIDEILERLQVEMSTVGRYRYVWALNDKTAKVSVRQLSNGRPGQLHLLFEQTKAHLGQVLGFGTEDCRGGVTYVADSPFCLPSSNTLIVRCVELSSNPIAVLDLSRTAQHHVAKVSTSLHQLVFECNEPKDFEKLTLNFEHPDGTPFYFGKREHAIVFRVRWLNTPQVIRPYRVEDEDDD